jgi:hypothetical protein
VKCGGREAHRPYLTLLTLPDTPQRRTWLASLQRAIATCSSPDVLPAFSFSSLFYTFSLPMLLFGSNLRDLRVALNRLYRQVMLLTRGLSDLSYRKFRYYSSLILSSSPFSLSLLASNSPLFHITFRFLFFFPSSTPCSSSLRSRHHKLTFNLLSSSLQSPSSQNQPIRQDRSSPSTSA